MENFQFRQLSFLTVLAGWGIGTELLKSLSQASNHLRLLSYILNVMFIIFIG